MKFSVSKSGLRIAPPHARYRCSLIFAAPLVLAILGGCGVSTPPRITPDAPDSSAAAQAMELYDTDHDGLLDAKELEKAPGLRAALKQLDTNKDGKVSADEIQARIQQWQESKMGRLPLTCTVIHKGQRLVGAQVKLVPEPFLGSAYHEGAGVTDGTGKVRPSVVNGDEPNRLGMSPGFYRVQITKSGEQIPSKYNSETILGLEVAADPEVQYHPPRFDLQY